MGTGVCLKKLLLLHIIETLFHFDIQQYCIIILCHINKQNIVFMISRYKGVQLKKYSVYMVLVGQNSFVLLCT